MNDNTPWAVFALVFSLFSLFVSILHHLAPEAAREDAPPVEQARAFGGEEADELADGDDGKQVGEVRDEDEAGDPAGEGVECGGVHGPKSTTDAATEQRRATR